MKQNSYLNGLVDPNDVVKFVFEFSESKLRKNIKKILFLQYIFVKEFIFYLPNRARSHIEGFLCIIHLQRGTHMKTEKKSGLRCNFSTSIKGTLSRTFNLSPSHPPHLPLLLCTFLEPSPEKGRATLLFLLFSGWARSEATNFASIAPRRYLCTIIILKKPPPSDLVAGHRHWTPENPTILYSSWSTCSTELIRASPSYFSLPLIS